MIIAFIVWVATVLLLGIWIGIIMSRHWLWKDEIEQKDRSLMKGGDAQTH